MLEKMSDTEKSEYNDALESVRKQQTKMKEMAQNGNEIKKQYLLKIDTMKNSNKKMLLLFSIEGCPACALIKYIIKYSDKVASVLEKIEYLEIDAANVRVDIIEKYGVYSYPQYFIIDSNENTIAKGAGCNALGDPEQIFHDWINAHI